MLVVADGERAALPLDGQFPGLKDPAVMIAEDRHEHGSDHLALRGIPVDVEIAGVPARRAVLQHVPPPGIGPASERHVVRHDVEHLAEPGPGQRPGQAPVGGSTAQLGVEAAVVDNVVTVRAARGCLQIGRAVEVADAQRGQIVSDGGSVVKGEARVQLDAVGRGPRPRAWGRRGNHRGVLQEEGLTKQCRVRRPLGEGDSQGKPA